MRYRMILSYWCSVILFVVSARTAYAQSLSETLGGNVGIDFLFNIVGAVIGGLANICFMLNNDEKFIKNVKQKALNNIVISIFVGSLIYLITEASSRFQIDDNLFQLAIVMLCGCFSNQLLPILGKKIITKVENDGK